MLKKTICFFLFWLGVVPFSAQVNKAPSLSFDFNEQQFKEVNDKVTIKAIGVTLTEDRFGNKKSAAYIHGHATSYINLGMSDLLKPKAGTISFWANIQSQVLAGKGYKGNPLLMTRNSAEEDFHFAYGIGFNWSNHRLGAQSTLDTIKEVMIFSKDTVTINTWYHFVLAYDNDIYALYLDGELQGKVPKGFESVFLEGDSVIVGRSMGYKNERYAHAIIDDIRFYPYVLNDEEVDALYKEPNPNRFKNILSEILKYSFIVVLLGSIILILIVRNRRNLKKQREYFELHTKIQELEIKVIKTQMNPHFISNCLAAIQNLIYTGQVDKAGEYIAKFSFFLRQVLEYSDKIYTSLAKELDIIKLNVELEQLRFKDNFRFVVNIDEGINPNDILIPSLITQPFIENAIWHGLLPLKERDPVLKINVVKKDNMVLVEIEDNGVGRSISEMLKDKNSKGTKLAADKIKSINQLRNSKDFKLEITDLFDTQSLPCGTKITIQLTSYTEE
jgi:hypothetical protein